MIWNAKKKFIIVIASAAIAIVAIGTVMLNRANAKPSITAEQAAFMVVQQYGGEVIGTEFKDAAYIVKLRTEAGLYNVTIPSSGERITAITRVEDAQQEVLDDDAQIAIDEPSLPGDKPSSPLDINEETVDSTPQSTPAEKDADNNATSTPEPAEALILSEQQAKDIALQQVSGDVDDIELKQSGDSRYYLVEIETREDKDAVIQVNAVTGKVMSITWDEDEDDDKDDLDGNSRK